MIFLNAFSRSFGSLLPPTSSPMATKRLWRSASVSLGFFFGVVLRGMRPYIEKLSPQSVEIPGTIRATPSVEFIVLLGHSGHNRNFLSVLHPAIGTGIRCRQTLIHARLLRADVRSYGLRLRLQFFRFFCLAVEKRPVLQQSFRDFPVGIRHGGLITAIRC